MVMIEGIPGEFGPQPWGEAVLRGCELLLLRITRRPADHVVRLPGLATTPRHVVEDRTGKALTWRRDGDDLLVRLPRSEELPVVRVALQGKLRIVPPDTVTANADGVWDLIPTGPAAHLVARRSADVAVRFLGAADPAVSQSVALANQSYAVPGGELVGSTIGPFPVRAGRVLRLSVWSSITRVLVAPVGTVLAYLHSPADGELQVMVTNFGRTAAHGEVFLLEPHGWTANPCQWTFDALAPGATITNPLTLYSGVSGGALRVQLDAGRRSAALPYRL